VTHHEQGRWINAPSEQRPGGVEERLPRTRNDRAKTIDPAFEAATPLGGFLNK
jgi:hypothetical protein